MMKWTPALLALSILALTPTAHAALFLSGVVSFSANSAGSTTSEPAEFDNIVGTGNSEVTINAQPRGTTFALTPGTNNFTFSGVFGGYNALSLYFAPTSALFSRPFGSLPDLVSFANPDATTPTLGSFVQTNGQFSGTLPWTGASSFTADGLAVTVTQLALSGGSGTFQLTVNAVPEPTSAVLLATAPLALCRRRR